MRCSQFVSIHTIRRASRCCANTSRSHSTPVRAGTSDRRRRDRAQYAEDLDRRNRPTADLSAQHSHLVPKGVAARIRRDVTVSFCGLLTDARLRILKEWLARLRQDTAQVDRLVDGRMVKWLKGHVMRRLMKRDMSRREQTFDVSIGRVLLWSSRRGRVFPVKGFDEEYFRVLLRSKFVLCSSGDQIWSYRFFEAVLCGAIPAFEETCPAYEGFEYLTMSNEQFVWSSAIADHNYALCVERLTVPWDELIAEIDALSSTV